MKQAKEVLKTDETEIKGGSREGGTIRLHLANLESGL